MALGIAKSYLFSSWISQSLEKVTSCCPWERFENWNELENLLLLSVSEDGILEINSMRQEVIIFIHPNEKEDKSRAVDWTPMGVPS